MNVAFNGVQSMENMPRGSKRFIKIISEVDNTRKEVLVIFEDTGMDVSEEDKKIAAEPFFATQAKQSHVGLALCQDLMTEHGGRIEIVNRGRP
jgi:nitrogen fixation/metabolism regulation signal transduction histidine kinase